MRHLAGVCPEVEIPLSPFLGTMGTHPDEPGDLPSFPPHRGGGNIDTRHLTVGSSLWLPVWCEGALFSCGDPHGVQGGAAPVVVGETFQVDPYPTASVQEGFADMWCASLSHCMKRFEGKRATYKNIRSGGVGCFTVDSFPVFDYMLPNVYVIADSNHGYKMIGVGREVARVVSGGHSSLLSPFRYERFATGDLHPVSNSPYPWS